MLIVISGSKKRRLSTQINRFLWRMYKSSGWFSTCSSKGWLTLLPHTFLGKGREATTSTFAEQKKLLSRFLSVTCALAVILWVRVAFGQILELACQQGNVIRLKWLWWRFMRKTFSLQTFLRVQLKAEAQEIGSKNVQTVGKEGSLRPLRSTSQLHLMVMTVLLFHSCLAVSLIFTYGLPPISQDCESKPWAQKSNSKIIYMSLSVELFDPILYGFYRIIFLFLRQILFVLFC